MIKTTCSFSLFILIYLVSSTFSSDSQPLPETEKLETVAIQNLEARGISENEAATLTDVLRNNIMNTGKYQVMERNEMESILKEQAFQQSGACSDEACIVEMGQVLGIEKIIAGSIGRVGKAYSINIRIISVQTGKITNSVSHNYTGPIENLLTSEMNVVANMLVGNKTVYQPRATMKRQRNKKKVRRNLFLSGLTLAAAGGGVAALIILKGNDKNDEPTDATLEVKWDQN